MENYRKALGLCDAFAESTFVARGLTDLGKYHPQMGDLQKSIDINKQALALRQEKNIHNVSITNLLNLGNVYKQQGNLAEAIGVLTQALKLAEEIKVNVKMYQVDKLLSDIYPGMGNTE